MPVPVPELQMVQPEHALFVCVCVCVCVYGPTVVHAYPYSLNIPNFHARCSPDLSDEGLLEHWGVPSLHNCSSHNESVMFLHNGCLINITDLSTLVAGINTRHNCWEISRYSRGPCRRQKRPPCQTLRALHDGQKQEHLSSPPLKLSKLHRWEAEEPLRAGGCHGHRRTNSI